MIAKRNARTAPADFNAELDALDLEIAATEAAGPPLDTLIAQAEAALDQAERHYRANGFARFPYPDQQANCDRLAVQGLAMIVGRDAVLAVERERVRRNFEAVGGVGLSANEKAQRLGDLHHRRGRLLAQHELALRVREADTGEMIADKHRVADLFLLADTELQRIVDDEKEAA